MSQVKIQGNASGTGVFTIAAPNSNTDRTLTLPDASGTVLTDSSGVLNIGSGQFYKDASGNVGIGTSSPSTNLHIYGATNSQIRLQNASNSHFVGNISGSMEIQSADIIKFLTSGANERVRISSGGNLLVGTTNETGDGGGLEIRGNEENGGFIQVKKTSSSVSGNRFMAFARNGSVVGSIALNGTTATAYNTSSDYRLKHDIAPMTGALAKVAALKPCTYKWNADGSSGEGFIAHELAEVVPDAVTGEKDAVETYTDEDGNEQTRPVYQGIDTSFLVATLTAAIQEQQAIITTLENRIAALENRT